MGSERRGTSSLIFEAVALVSIGIVLAVVYNVAGLYSDPPFGLPWVGEDRSMVDFETLEGRSDPTAASQHGSEPRPIEASGSPVPIALEDLKRYHELDGALIVDARGPEDYAAGHIAGAISLPYDDATPDRLEALDSGGRPIVTYCSGNGCEVSVDLAYDLLAAGHAAVANYEGGFPEWESAGYDVDRSDGGEPVAETAFRTDIDDPMGFFGGAEAEPVLPYIPELDRPIKMQMENVKMFYDAGSALMVDAREPEEFLVGHIAGAVNLPLEATTPEILGEVRADGNPIIVYCGGEPCDVSMELAYELIEAGHSKVLVYAGGFREWDEAGYPVARGGDR